MKALKYISFIITVSVFAILGYITLHLSSAQTVPTVAASSVDSFVQSEGVDVHLVAAPVSTGNTVLSALQALGVKTIRTNISSLPFSNAAMQTFSTLQSKGIKIDFVFDGPYMCQIDPLLATIKSNFSQAVIAVENANEWNAKSYADETASIKSVCPDQVIPPDSASNPAWVTEDRDMQQALYSAVEASSLKNQLGVVGPSLGAIQTVDQAPVLGNLSAYMTAGNLHSYPKRDTPENTIGAYKQAEAANVSGSKPIWSTETGYNSCTSCISPTQRINSTQHLPVGESTLALIYPRLYLAGYMAGIQQTQIYELFGDDTATSHENGGGLAVQNSSGYSFLPTGQSIANMNAILNSGDTGPASVPSLQYSLTGPADIKQLLLAKHTAAGDRYELIVWNNTIPWNFSLDSQGHAANTALPVSSEPIHVTFGSQVSISQYQPTTQTAATKTYSSINSLDGSASPAITIYDITVTGPLPSSSTSGGTSGSTTTKSHGTGVSNPTGSGATQSASQNQTPGATGKHGAILATTTSKIVVSSGGILLLAGAAAVYVLFRRYYHKRQAVSTASLNQIVTGKTSAIIDHPATTMPQQPGQIIQPSENHKNS